MKFSPILLGVLTLIPMQANAYTVINLDYALPRATAEVVVSGETENLKTFDSVGLNFREKAKLLALVSIEIKARAVAYPDGRVTVEYPWYASLSVDQKKAIETEFRIVVNQTLKKRMVGS